MISGLNSRKDYVAVLRHVEYTPTNLGCSLKSVPNMLWNWGEEYSANNITAEATPE